mgnify:CR=1 FL=1|tara:strand:- start:384 stop:569 length:186 start_codon:yes stop_codon:yes gene_type:complete
MKRLLELLEQYKTLEISYLSHWQDEEYYTAEDTVQAKEIINYGINNQFAVYVNGERFTGLI